jgi:hypothetical protein
VPCPDPTRPARLGGDTATAHDVRSEIPVVTDARKLDEVNEAMADVLAGHVPARVVFQF